MSEGIVKKKAEGTKGILSKGKGRGKLRVDGGEKNKGMKHRKLRNI